MGTIGGLILELGLAPLGNSFSHDKDTKACFTMTRSRRGLVVKVSDFHARGRGFDSRSGQAAQ